MGPRIDEQQRSKTSGSGLCSPRSAAFDRWTVVPPSPDAEETFHLLGDKIEKGTVFTSSFVSSYLG